jgi:hypothetical protein
MAFANTFGDTIWNEVAFRELNSMADPFMVADLARRGNAIINQTKQRLTDEGHVDTGRLRASYTYVIEQDGEGIYMDCGSNVEYAPFVEARFPHLVPSLPAGGI